MADVAINNDYAPVGIAQTDATPAPNAGDLFRSIFGNGGTATAAEDADLVAPVGEAETVALPVIPEAEPTEAEPSVEQGPLAALGFGQASGAQPVSQSALPQVAPGTVLPYGEVARVCGLTTRNLGRAIESAAGYTVYDTAPTSTAPRTHYITGFDDGCARQFSGALVMLGDVGTHEFIRYSPTHAGRPYSETDRAYEEIKGRFCGVSSGQPCGTRIDQLARNTLFVTVYPRFGGNGDWFEMLLHQGNVVATGIEGN